jgi:hypothetical protein
LKQFSAFLAPVSKRVSKEISVTELAQDILIANGYMAIKGEPVTKIDPKNTALATVVSNLAYYGYALNKTALAALASLDELELEAFWDDTKPVLAELSKENRSIDKFVVFKNFPREVLDMEDAEYTMRQVLIYNGLPYDAVAEKAEPRAPLGDIKRLKVLSLADERTGDRIFSDLMSLNNRWSDNQIVWAKRLIGLRNVLDLDDFGFKENGIALIVEHFDTKEFRVSTGTDVLRLAAGLSEADVSLRTKPKFRSFNRPERRKLLAMMDASKNLADDFAARPEQFKRLLERLRPGDYAFDNVKAAYDGLYNKSVRSFSALVDPQEPVEETLDIVATRPGEFLRRFHHFYDLFGSTAAERMVGVLDKLTSRQLVNFRAYLGSINSRSTLIYPPKANWARAQIAQNKKGKIAEHDLKMLDDAIGEELRSRMEKAFPEGIALGEDTDRVKLQTNDQKLAEYGRGTRFPIPDDVNYIRTASFWQMSVHGWFDNGWNFFDENWKSMGVCSWEFDHSKFKSGAAVFSGDPMNSGNSEGKATQLIDLYLDQLKAKGVRYAVWNILCYSRIKFSDTDGEVMGLLQWGDQPNKGKLITPSLCQMVFPLKADAMASFIAYVDVETRELVYMDAPLRADVSGASHNGKALETVMPAYVEYLESLPTVRDLLRDAPEGDMPVLFSDRDVAIEADRAFVFRPENAENSYDRVSVADLLKIAE